MESPGFGSLGSGWLAVLDAASQHAAFEYQFSVCIAKSPEHTDEKPVITIETKKQFLRGNEKQL